MVKQQKNNRKKQSSKGFTANSAKASKINASTGTHRGGLLVVFSVNPNSQQGPLDPCVRN